MKKELLKEKLEEIKALFDKYTIEELVNTYNDIDNYKEESINNFCSVALDNLEQLAENNRREKPNKNLVKLNIDTDYTLKTGLMNQ